MRHIESCQKLNCTAATHLFSLSHSLSAFAELRAIHSQWLACVCVWRKSNSWKIYKYQISIHVISAKSNMEFEPVVATLDINTNNSRSIQSIGMCSIARTHSLCLYLSFGIHSVSFATRKEEKKKVWIQISVIARVSLQFLQQQRYINRSHIDGKHMAQQQFVVPLEQQIVSILIFLLYKTMWSLAGRMHLIYRMNDNNKTSEIKCAHKPNSN